MTVCRNCGVEIEEGLELCPLCRAPLRGEVAEKEHDTPPPQTGRPAEGMPIRLARRRLWEIVSLFAAAAAVVGPGRRFCQRSIRDLGPLSGPVGLLSLVGRFGADPSPTAPAVSTAGRDRCGGHVPSWAGRAPARGALVRHPGAPAHFAFGGARRRGDRTLTGPAPESSGCRRRGVGDCRAICCWTGGRAQPALRRFVPPELFAGGLRLHHAPRRAAVLCPVQAEGDAQRHPENLPPIARRIDNAFDVEPRSSRTIALRGFVVWVQPLTGAGWASHDSFSLGHLWTVCRA